ncbi:MAG: thioredoxin-dependent thiol peroxidase [Anaerolineaceae bacterium]|nr:thioredoxin-dependent thiol peroxidase [Anaerolineaceae bacterium]
MVITNDIQAPDFSLLNQDEETVNLSDYKGKKVVLYFYPKDDTKGCTTEACNFRDDYSAYEKTDIVILGVSADSPASHRKFQKKYDLPFTLLSDEEHIVCELYGVWGLKKFMGREYDGIFRTTFLINGNGKIIKVFENVKPAAHSEEVLAAFSE